MKLSFEKYVLTLFFENMIKPAFNQSDKKEEGL